MIHSAFETETPEGALHWMLSHDMIVRSSIKDPETLARIHGYILSDELREKIGSNMVKLISKAASRNGALSKETVRDAFLMATMAAVLEVSAVSLNEEEMTHCANIIMALLPIGRLEEAGVSKKTLRSLTQDRSLVGKIRRICGQPRY
jgi:hypothetical protein